MKEQRKRVKVPSVFEDIIYKRARYKGAYGGRGSGKSHTFATLAVDHGLRKPSRILCCREFQYSIDQSVKHIVEQKVHDQGFEYKMRSAKTYTMLTHDNGGESEFIYEGLHLNTSAVRSMENVDIAWIDEAQSISQKSLDDLIPTIRKDGSELWFSWNPHSPNDPVDRLLRGMEPPPFSQQLMKFYDELLIVKEVNYHDNPWFSEILRAEMKRDKMRDYARYQHVWKGKYRRHSEAAVFRNWRVGTKEEFERFSPPGEKVEGKIPIKRYYFGADWGFAIDPTVLVRCFIHERTLYVDAEVYAHGCEVDHRPFLFGGMDDFELRRLNAHALQSLVYTKQQLWLGIPGSRKWAIVADGASPEVISYMKRHGFPRMIEAKKGAGSVNEGIEFLQSHDIVVHPNCVHAAEELGEFSYKIDPRTDEVIPVLEDDNNHVIDAIRYAVEGTRHSTYNLESLAS